MAQSPSPVHVPAKAGGPDAGTRPNPLLSLPREPGPADQLAGEGLPEGGGVSYGILDETRRFGTADFLADVNLTRALESEPTAITGSIAGLRVARVPRMMPERKLFRHDRTGPSASITLRMDGREDAALRVHDQCRAPAGAKTTRSWPRSSTTWTAPPGPVCRHHQERSVSASPRHAKKIRMGERRCAS